MQTKLTFFRSYYKMGWWAARVPVADWTGSELETLGFGYTQTQAERDLVRKEQARLEVAEIAA